MKHTYVITLLASLLVAGLCAPAAAQITITNEMRPICAELPDSTAARSACAEYYAAKQAVMNQVVADITAAVTSEPGKAELLTTVAGEILELHNALHDMQVKLNEVLPEDNWTENLNLAIEDEVAATDIAGEYWGLMAYLGTMTFEDVMTMMDAVDDFDDKAEVLKGMAEVLARNYQEAESVANGDFELEIVDSVRSDFASDVFMAKTLGYSTSNMGEDLEDVLETYNPETRFQNELEYVHNMRESLPEDWDLLHEQLDTAGEDLDTMYDDALFQLTERKQIMDDEALFDEFGAPFKDIGYEEIGNAYEEMYNILLEELGLTP